MGVIVISLVAVVAMYGLTVLSYLSENDMLEEVVSE